MIPIQLEDFENYPTDLEKAKAFIREDFSAMLDFYTRNQNLFYKKSLQ